MATNFKNEKWKSIQFDFKYANDTKVEVSDMGRIRTFNRISNGNIIQPSIINGYAILRLKFYKAREEDAAASIAATQNQINKLLLKINKLQTDKASKQIIKDAITQLNKLKNNLALKLKKDMQERTIHYNGLVHRLVATYFVKKSSKKQEVVAHINHDKTNNAATNLKWMTIEENYAHQQKSPLVIAERKLRKNTVSPNVSKLKESQVITIKKMLLQKKTIVSIAQKFDISETQIIRIKNGENWSNVKWPK